MELIGYLYTRDIPFTHEELLTWLDCNPATGKLVWIARPTLKGRAIIGEEAGTLLCRKGIPQYFHTQIKGCRLKNHRLIWFYMTGDWPKQQIDHINGNGLDNRWANLREASPGENSRNRNQKVTSKNMKGTTKVKSGKWLAQINYEGETIRIGLYETEEEAHYAYCKRAEELHGAFAKTV